MSTPRRRLVMQAFIMLMVALMIFSPAAALAMSHCAGMMSAVCQGPCASYACADSPDPLVQALIPVEDAVTGSVGAAPDVTPVTPHPPPRPRSLAA